MTPISADLSPAADALADLAASVKLSKCEESTMASNSEPENILRSSSDGLLKAEDTIARMKYVDISELYQAAHESGVPYQGRASSVNASKAKEFMGAIIGSSPTRPEPLTYFYGRAEAFTMYPCRRSTKPMRFPSPSVF